eukprot:TRINITY_DN2084_c1_g1_i2.p1 TRINITY_DN2084_c1_g1~~TRINITY_DN2084_c1_g1_i2.p1  ORF type:complete len:140 (+),score=13.64 TRINITY_DN2084_c1_g1_i2:77-496(+)
MLINVHIATSKETKRFYSRLVRMHKCIVYAPPVLVFHLDRFGKNMKSQYETKWNLGQNVLVNWKKKGKFYKAKISKLEKNRLEVDYNDGDLEWISCTEYAEWRIKKNPRSGKTWYSSNKFENAIKIWNEVEIRFKRKCL